MMADVEIFKDIPGYKAILKAVLKKQIQFLVSVSNFRVSFFVESILPALMWLFQPHQSWKDGLHKMTFLLNYLNLDQFL